MTKSVRTVYLISLGVSLLGGATISGGPAIAPGGRTLFAWTGQQAGRGAPPKPDAPTPQQILEGTDENDTLTGGDGDDWLFGKKGIDILRGGRGRDKIDGGDGDDNIDGGPDADIIDGGAGIDTILGAAGNDTIDGGDDDDLLNGGDGTDDMDGGDGVDTVRGGGGNDVLAGGDENDAVHGDAGDDRVSGNDGNDQLTGGAGNDVLKGGEGNDQLGGDAGDDRLDGNDGNDLLLGGAGNDMLLGSSGGDTLQGEAGHDTLLGGDGVDMVDGGLGMDWLFGGFGADVVLGGDGDDICVVRAGDVASGEVELINGGAGTDVLFLTGFTETFSAKGELRLVDPVTGGLYIIVNVERIEHTVVVPPVDPAATGPLSLLLVNPSTTAAAGRVIFFGKDGAIVPASRGAGEAATDDLTFSVPALGSLRIDAVVTAPAVAQVFTASPMAVSGRGVRAAALFDTALMPVIEDAAAGISTGIVLAGSVADTSVNLSLYSMDGRELDADLFLGAKEVLVPAYGHVVVFARDLFPHLKNFRGLLALDGGLERPQEGGPLSAMVLERNASGAMAVSSVASLTPPSSRGSQHLANVTVGGDTESTLILINPSNARSQGTIRFFDEAGRPWYVAVNGQRAADSMPFDLTPTGGAAFVMPRSATVQQGSVRVEPAQGTVTALLRQSSKTGVTHVNSSGEYSSFISAATRDAASGTTTRLSISSTGSAVTLRLRLRTAAGTEVAGGTVELKLPANGYTSRTLEQLFPTASTDRFDGTLTVQVEGGTVAATSMSIGPGASQSTVLPIIKLN